MKIKKQQRNEKNPKLSKTGKSAKRSDWLLTTNWLRTTILVLAACCIVGLLLTVILSSRETGPTYATAKLELTFDGAAKGTAPNGVAFNLSDMDCDEVLTAGLKAASLEGVYTPEQLRPSLTVRGVYPSDMAEQVMYYESLLDFSSSRELSVGNYHPTTFSVTLYNDFDKSISRSQLTALLKGITEAYRDYFARTYAYGLDSDSSIFNLEDYDYPQQLDIIENRLNRFASYARELYRKDPAFLFQGASFNDIYVRLSGLLDSSDTKVQANLIIKGLTKDPDRLLTQYAYQIIDLGIRRDKQHQELVKLDQLINSYEKHETIYLSTSESLTKIDGNSSATYDALVNRRKSLADSITDLDSRITNYNLRIDDLVNSTGLPRPEVLKTNTSKGGLENGEGNKTTVIVKKPTAAEIAEAERRLNSQREALEESIRTIVTDGEAVISDFGAMLENYNAQLINESNFAVSTPRYVTPTLINRSFISRAIETAGPLVALGFMVCMVLIIISRKKEEKEI